MTDHYRRARAHLEDVCAAREALAEEYARQPGSRAKVVADLHQRIGHDLKLADVHATLAVAQALQDGALHR